MYVQFLIDFINFVNDTFKSRVPVMSWGNMDTLVVGQDLGMLEFFNNYIKSKYEFNVNYAYGCHVF